MDTLNQDNMATCEHCNILFDMEDGPFYSGPNTGFYCCEDCIVQAGYEYCVHCDEWHSLENGITANIENQNMFFCSSDCFDTFAYNENLELPKEILDRITATYFEAMIFVANEDELNPDDLYSPYEFTKGAWARAEKLINKFYIESLKVGFDIMQADDYTQSHFGHDAFMQNMGCGFNDIGKQEIYGEYTEKLAKIAKFIMPEVYCFLLDDKYHLDFESC